MRLPASVCPSPPWNQSLILSPSQETAVAASASMSAADLGPTLVYLAAGRGAVSAISLTVISLNLSAAPPAAAKSSSSRSNSNSPPSPPPSSSSSSEDESLSSNGARGIHRSAATVDAHVAAHPLFADSSSSAAGVGGAGGVAEALALVRTDAGSTGGGGRPKSLACWSFRTAGDRAKRARATHVAPSEHTSRASTLPITFSQHSRGISDSASTAD
mmetsp:Transcript_12159/g.55293  ORF Transcript_12159/g.55293 Transcript_12159/m.55293 type:complete len:216 (+) Transcript_12159:1342-1989(+)